MFKKLLTLLLTTATFGGVAQAQPSQPTVLYAGITNVLNGTDGQCLSILTGVLNAAACAGIATSIVINSTDVTSGVNGDVLIIGSGKVQQLARLPFSNLTQAATNTVFANVTGGTADLAPVAVSSCSTSSSALTWTTNTGFTCNTSINAATLGGNAIGTSGTTVPLLNTTNTWSANQTVQGLTTTAPSWLAQLTGDTFARVAIGLNTSDTPRLSMGSGSAARDTFIERVGAGSFRLGTIDAASPVAQTVSVQNVATGTTNTAGTDLTLNGSRGTGTGAGGAVHIAVAPAGTTGSSQNALADALLISSDKSVAFSGTAKLAAIVENQGGACTAVSISGGVVTLPLASNTNFCLTSNANITSFAVTGCPGTMTSWTLWITADGSSYSNSTAWSAANIQWQNSVPPVLSTTLNNVDVVSARSKNACSSFQAAINQNYTP